MHSPQNVQYIDRKSGKLVAESVMGDKALRFAYNTLLGRTLWPILFGGRMVSALMGRYYDSAVSRRSIAGLTQIPGCRVDEAEFPPETYSSFNAFFARHLRPGARPFDADGNIIISPADGRLLVFPECVADSPVPVKGAQRTIGELCLTPLPFERAAVAVIRLAPVDYHRYHFPCQCTMGEKKVFPGKYHSVNPVALCRRPDLFVENTRHVTALDSVAAGSFFMIEVAAFGVGSIIATAMPGEHAKMDEKGYFKFGGSTVILVFDRDRVTFDDDLLKNSASGIETLVRCGERIAEAVKI